MKKNYPLALFLLLCLSLFISCSDDDNNDDSNGSVKLLLQKLTATDNSFEMRYHYDAQNRIVKMEEDEKEDGIDITIYEYNSENNPVKKVESYTDDSDTYLTTYTYKDDSIFVKMFEINSQTKVSTIDTLTIDNKGCLKKIHSSYGSYIAYSTYTYNNAAQLTQSDYYNRSEDYETNGTDTYSYDNKKGYFSHVNVKPWFINYELDIYRHTNVSNSSLITNSSSHKDLKTGETQTSTSKTELTYTYNEDGYPITMSEKIHIW
ncbi:MAG: hypothetical protein LBV71_09230 [Prevotella sp.]|jgi:hypothetical protein|nr:hypothetical protein [Prevotella sp.]